MPPGPLPSLLVALLPLVCCLLLLTASHPVVLLLRLPEPPPAQQPERAPGPNAAAAAVATGWQWLPSKGGAAAVATEQGCGRGSCPYCITIHLGTPLLAQPAPDSTLRRGSWFNQEACKTNKQLHEAIQRYRAHHPQWMTTAQPAGPRAHLWMRAALISALWCTLGDHRPRIQSAAVSASAQVVCGQVASRHHAQAGQLAGGSGGQQKGAA